MWKNNRWRLTLYKPSKFLAIKIIAVILSLSLLLLTASLGIADPTTAGPTPR